MLYVFGYNFPVLYTVAQIVLCITLFVILIDLLLLFANRSGINAERLAFYKLSNGDNNEIIVTIDNNYSFLIDAEIMDEVPYQFQMQDFRRKKKIEAGRKYKFTYTLRPTSRGEYNFGNINVLVGTRLSLARRKFSIAAEQMLPCYPSFLKLKQFELMAISDRLTDLGIKKLRRIGNSTEFDHIKEYVIGNDVRTINWKATARKNQLMVNHFRDERAQHVYSVIDMGRAMKMPFEGLSLLDYAINSSLVLSHINYVKHDKPGLIGFSNHLNFAVAAERKGNQLFKIQEALYNAETNYAETNYETLLTHVKAKITQRSLLLLYTNFETLRGLNRQLKYLRQLAKNHLLVVIIFKNTELETLLKKKAATTYEMYQQTIASKFDYEKCQVSVELKRFGIQCVYTEPSNLTVNTLNKYIELKARGLI